VIAREWLLADGAPGGSFPPAGAVIPPVLASQWAYGRRQRQRQHDPADLPLSACGARWATRRAEGRCSAGPRTAERFAFLHSEYDGARRREDYDAAAMYDHAIGKLLDDARAARRQAESSAGLAHGLRSGSFGTENRSKRAALGQ
jgi:hypothetical protein